jgi:hypothetical protein
LLREYAAVQRIPGRFFGAALHPKQKTLTARAGGKPVYGACTNPLESQVKITSIAARLHIVAAELEELAARESDMDLPEEVIVPFLAQVISDPMMIGGLLSRSMGTAKVSDPPRKHPEPQ